jgi:hypothetical protein
MTKRNYMYVSDNSVVIITDESRRSADKTLKETVRDPTAFCFDHSEQV